MSKPLNQKEEWTPCPPGTLTVLAGHERGRQRRQFLVRTGSALGVIALTSGAGWLAFRRTGMPTDPIYAGIACSRVRELAPQYMMGQLDVAMSQQMKSHLELCADCRNMLESMQPKMSAHSPHGGSAEGCSCSSCSRDGLVQSLATIDSPQATSQRAI